MNAGDIVKYGQLTVNQAVADLAPAHWETPGVCGNWSVRQIIAHLASYEAILTDILSQLLGEPSNGMVARYTSPDGDFNDREVAARQEFSPQAALEELTTANARNLAMLARIPPAALTQPGTLPWYGAEYAIDDYIVYANYGHKREHTAQIDRFRSTLGA
jgi:uncharacterized protein (TIGR03083 family)